MIVPTIGRKVWFWPTAQQYLRYTADGSVAIENQPFDATVIAVWGDRCVNLRVTDHEGNQFTRTSVPLNQPGDAIHIEEANFATWMPYQVQTAKQQV